MSIPSTLRKIAQRLLPLLDLTPAEPPADEAALRRLCARARTPAGNVAALYVAPALAPAARAALAGSAVPVAVAVARAEEAASADEIDLLLPLDVLAERDAVVPLVRGARAVCGRKTLLKVVLDTGRLADPARIRAAAEAAIEGGADFLVTATDVAQPGATPEAAAILLAVIAAAQRRRRWVGFKAAGGIRTLSDAQPYLALYDRVMGEGAASAAGFRIGGDALLGDVLLALGLAEEV